jgi:hypothetical protein
MGPSIMGSEDEVEQSLGRPCPAEGPSGRAKIHADDPKHALGLTQYLRTIGYNALIEDTNGNEIDEKALKMAIRSRLEDAPSS